MNTINKQHLKRIIYNALLLMTLSEGQALEDDQNQQGVQNHPAAQQFQNVPAPQQPANEAEEPHVWGNNEYVMSRYEGLENSFSAMSSYGYIDFR